MNFDEAFSKIDKTPIAVLVYAQWADDYLNYLNKFRQVQPKYKNIYNFVELDIASKDTKTFNNMYHIQPKLPYLFLIRNNGKISRYISRECAKDTSCINSKLMSFIQ